MRYLYWKISGEHAVPEEGKSFSIMSLLVLVQSLPTISKIGISLALEIIAAVAIWQIWQKPTRDRIDEGAKAETNVTISQSDGAQGSFSTGGHPGSATSSGQMGGITAGNYYQFPPTSEQQKAEALIKLRAELEELHQFPRRQVADRPPTIVENMYENDLPFKLYATLSKYYKVSIESVPTIGSRLRDFQKQYYAYQETETSAEDAVINQIGQIPKMKGKISGYFAVMLKYFIMRSAGQSVEQIFAQHYGIFEPFTINQEDAESVYNTLLTVEAGKKLAQHQEEYRRLSWKASKLLSDMKTSD